MNNRNKGSEISPTIKLVHLTLKKKDLDFITQRRILPWLKIKKYKDRP